MPLIPQITRRYDRLPSTNAAAVAALTAGEGLGHGDVWVTSEQTAGRGQGTNRWHASPGDNLTLSLVLRPDHLAVERLFALTQWTSLAVARTVAHYLPADRAAGVRIKWPNDVYVGDRKIAGILVQNGLRGNRVSWSVVGIGLNVNEGDFPDGLRSSATTLHLRAAPPTASSRLSASLSRLDTEEVLSRLLDQLATAYPLTHPREQLRLDRHYHGLLYRLNQRSNYRIIATGERLSGTIRGVTAAGRLRLEGAEGSERTFALREVKFL